MSGLQLHKKENLLAAYQDLRPTLEALCFAVDGVLRRIIPARYVVATSHRVKRFDSFYEKANKLRGEELKYRQPVQEITDLVGFRIIVIAKRNVEQACEIIRNSFKILDEENKADKLLEEGKLGYESHHLMFSWATLGRRSPNMKGYVTPLSKFKFGLRFNMLGLKTNTESSTKLARKIRNFRNVFCGWRE